MTHTYFKIPENCIAFQLQDTTMDQASDLFKTNEDHELLAGLKAAGLSGEAGAVDELSVKFEEHSEQLQEVGPWI